MHPSVKIAGFIFMVLLVNFLNYQQIFLLGVLVSVGAIKVQRRDFFQVIRRMRWLFLSIFLIYAWTTPGEYIRYFPLNFSPTIEGSISGFVQIVKLLIILALLHILFVRNSKQSLMYGLYYLLTPLKYFGFNVDRFVVRLILTLEYVEELTAQSHGKINFTALHPLLQPTDVPSTKMEIALHTMPLRTLDKFWLTGFAAGLSALFVSRML